MSSGYQNAVPDRAEIQRRVIEVVARERGRCKRPITPETDLVYELGTAGDDGVELLNAIAKEFALDGKLPPDYRNDIADRFGGEGWNVPPLNFLFIALEGGIVWLTRLAGLHNKRVEEVLIWPPSRVFEKDKTAPIKVSEVVDEVEKIFNTYVAGGNDAQ